MTAKPTTPGQQYAADFLPGTDNCAEEWVARMIDAGRLAVCPRCHFARLPKNPFGVDAVTVKQLPHVTEDACEVCASLPEAIRLYFPPASPEEGLRLAPQALTDARRARALLLFHYWFDSCDAANTLVWAAMREGLQSMGIVSTAEGENASQKGEGD